MTDNATSQPLTLTKLLRPPVGRELVARQGLLERLNREQRLTLILAPAGYGKTTLISSWLETCGRPSAWLSLDEHDDDPVALVTYLAAAVQTLFPAVCDNTLTSLSGLTTPPVAIMTRSLLNDLTAIQQDFILVVDDYHVIRNQAIHDLMAELVRHPPRALHLVLASRQDPPLPLAGLRARGHVVELRAADLRFTLEEAAVLLREVMKVEADERTISLLTTKTEGWPVGLRLAAMALRQQRVPGMIAPDSSGYNRYITDYLITEVLSQLPISVQEFLIKTSILDQLCGPLCEAVTDMRDRMFNGQYLLEWVERSDLFLVPVDEQRRWYRYHHLFRQFLQHRLEQQHGPAEIAALHLRASAWFAQNGYADEALQHALAAGDTPVAVQIVGQHRHDLMNREQWPRLARWGHLFPPQAIEEYPDLLLSQVWMKFLRQQLADIPLLLDRAETLIAHMTLTPDVAQRLQGEVEARRSAQFYWAGDLQRSLIAAQRALERLPSEWWYIRGYTRLFLSGAYQMSGDLTQAYATLYAAGEREQSCDYQMLLLGSAGFIHWIAADLPGMMQVACQVVTWPGKPEHSEIVAWSNYHLGLHYYQRNDLVAAEKHLLPLVLQPYASHAMCFLNSAVLLARIRQAQGQPAEALEIANVMLSFALETRSEVALFHARSFQAELAARQGRLAEASQWAEQYGPVKLAPFPYFFVPPLTLALILLVQNTPASRQQARQLLSQLGDYFTSIHYTSLQIRVLALQASLYVAEGDEPQARAVLAQAIGLAEPGGFIRLFFELGSQLEPLLTQLLRQGVAVEYITEILAAGGSAEPYPSSKSRPGVQPTLARETLPREQSNPPVEALTNREMDVLLLLARRLTNKEIAQTLGISPNTVKQHTLTLFQKLQVHNRREAVEWARENHLLPTA